ncbi:MAG: hypothetical protein WCQ57_05550 [Verrucomicrobiota bacterium]
MPATADTFPVCLAYGRGYFNVQLPAGRTEALEPLFQPGLRDIALSIGDSFLINVALKERLARLGPDARVAALPQGPLTLPYLA